MDGIRFSILCVIGFTGLGILNAQIVPPVLMDKVEPEYSANFTSFVLDPARVQMVVDERGNPFALTSTSSLPDNVVQALSKWRFRPGTKNRSYTSFTLVVNVPVRRPLSDYLQSAGRPSYLTDGLSQVPKDTRARLTPATAAEIEKKLKDNGESVDVRTELLAFAANRNDPDAVEMRARQISWLVQHRPGSRVLGTPNALIFATPGPLQDAAGYEAIRNLWLDQVSKDPDDAMVLGHATWFLQLADPEKAEALLIPAAPKMGGAAAWLGELYASAALGVTRLKPNDGRPTDVGDRIPGSGFPLHARSMLANTKDERILLSAVATLTRLGWQLKETGGLPDGYAQFCQELLSKVKTFDADVSYSCAPAGSGAAPGSSGGTVQPARLVTKVTPVYPAEAKSRRIQGTARFSATIGKDGKLRDLQLLSAPVIFYESSRKAVLQWEYRPTALNGEPIEVITQIDVHYTLQ